MGLRFATAQDRDTITQQIVDAAEHASLRLTPPELVSSPPLFQQADGTSTFRPLQLPPDHRMTDAKIGRNLTDRLPG